MATVTRPGWEVDDPNNSSDIIKATLPAKLLPSPGAGVAGSPSRLLVKTNISNGNYDVYKPGGFLQGDRLIYSVNASNDKLVIKDQSLYNSYFDKNNAQGKAQLDSLNKTIKVANYDNAQLNTGTDPVRNQNFENIKKTDAYKSLANKQTPGNRLTPDDTPGATVPSPENASETAPTEPVEAEKFKSKENTNTGVSGTLKYPADIANSQDKIKFDILEYSPRGLTTGNFQSEGGAGAFGLKERDSGRKAIATIFLPIPGGISDTNTAGWGDDRMNAFQLIGANTALQSITQGLQKGASVLSEAAESVSTPAGNNESKSALASAFAGFALQGEGSQILSRTTGQVLNPNLELLFTGPELRSFNFTFKMSARNKPEADDIVKIIRIFKQSMSSQRSKAQLFAKAPNTFRIQYLHKNGPDHTRIGKIKECALVSMTTNYTPEGQYATYEDGTPISYEIQLQFKELEPVFNDEYGALGDSHIGF